MATAIDSPEQVVPNEPCNKQAAPCNHEDDPARSGANELFHKLWRNATDDNTLSLYGFRRYRTTHLLNLRLLEHEIDKMDHHLFQAGLRLSALPTTGQRLGLKYCRRDTSFGAQVAVPAESMLQLRALIKQYDDALLAFNGIMLMETFALADNDWQSSLRTDFNPYETYKTRLVRIDLPRRSCPKDPFRHNLRRLLRGIWFFGRKRKEKSDQEWRGESAIPSALESELKKSYQNTNDLAEYLTRFLVALLAGPILVVPLVVLSRQSSSDAHLTTVSVCIVMFSLVVSLLTRASNQETMAASAAYAAVLVVFVSGSLGT